MFGLGPLEFIIILVVILVIFGPKNLPKLGSALGKTVKNIREGMESSTSDTEASKAETPNVTQATSEAPNQDEVHS